MGFDDLIKKGEAALAGKDGKVDYKDLGQDAQDAYKTYNTTEGDFNKKAQAVYAGYQKDAAEDAKKEAGKESEKK